MSGSRTKSPGPFERNRSSANANANANVNAKANANVNAKNDDGAELKLNLCSRLLIGLGRLLLSLGLLLSLFLALSASWSALPPVSLYASLAGKLVKSVVGHLLLLAAVYHFPDREQIVRTQAVVALTGLGVLLLLGQI